MFPNNTQKLMLHNINHVESLARHVFKNDPIGMRIVEKSFAKIVKPEIKVIKPRDFTMHHIPA
jgi:hypothetical protein